MLLPLLQIVQQMEILKWKTALEKNLPSRPYFCLFLFFSNTNFTEKTEDVSGIQTRIVGVEGKHADHLTTTTTKSFFSKTFSCNKTVFANA